MTLEEWKSQTWSELSLKTIEEIESENMYPDDGRVPHVPFGFANKDWLKFKSQMQPGDQIYYYCSSPESWYHLAGRGGYALFHDGQFVDSLTTLMN